MSLSHAKPLRQPAGPAVVAPARLDRDALCAWLSGPEPRCADGQVLSWCNPSHPGYPYPEATALWLSWAAWRGEKQLEGPPVAAVRATATWLHRQLSRDGAIGRDGRHYAFDTGLAFHALVRAARVPDLLALRPQDLAPLSAGLEAFLDADTPTLPPAAGPERWSDRWVGHHLRSAALVLLAGRWLDCEATQARALRILERVTPLLIERDGYLHTLAYQAEGELLLTRLGLADHSERVRAACQRLAELQRPDGLLPGWPHRPQSARCDTTVQALRLWVATDPERFATPCIAALGGLSRCQHSGGGLPYEPGTRDLNTWVGLFADQASHWFAHGAEPADLL